MVHSETFTCRLIKTFLDSKKMNYIYCSCICGDQENGVRLFLDTFDIMSYNIQTHPDIVKDAFASVRKENCGIPVSGEIKFYTPNSLFSFINNTFDGDKTLLDGFEVMLPPEPIVLDNEKQNGKDMINFPI